MDLHKQILINALAEERIEIVFPQLETSLEDLLEGICYQTLQKSRLSLMTTALMMKSVL